MHAAAAILLTWAWVGLLHTRRTTLMGIQNFIAIILCVFAYVDPMLSTLSIVCQITVNRECIQSVGIELLECLFGKSIAKNMENGISLCCLVVFWILYLSSREWETNSENAIVCGKNTILLQHASQCLSKSKATFSLVMCEVQLRSTANKNKWFHLSTSPSFWSQNDSHVRVHERRIDVETRERKREHCNRPYEMDGDDDWTRAPPESRKRRRSRTITSNWF